jgi:hypothetical protein
MKDSNPRSQKKVMMVLAALLFGLLALVYGWKFYKAEALKDAIELRVLSINASLNHLLNNPDRITYGEFFLEIPKSIERVESERIALESVNDSAIPGLRTASVNYATKVRFAMVALREQISSTVRADLANDAFLALKKRSDGNNLQSLTAMDPRLLQVLGEQNIAKIEAEPDRSKKIKLLQDGAAVASALSIISSFNAAKQSAENAKADQADKLRELIQAGDELFIAGTALNSLSGRSLAIGRFALKGQP